MGDRTTTMSFFQNHKLILGGAIFGFLFISAPVVAEENSEKSWMVQLGSFREEINAERFVSRIKKKGYTPFVAKAENSKLYKVRVGPYPSKNGAIQVAKGLKKNQGITALVVLSEGTPPDLENSGDSIDVVISQLLIWKKAWEERKVNTYLSFYSKSFKVPQKSHKDWIAQRRSALNGNSRISIQISDVQMKQNHETIEISFIQEFKSDIISNVGRKELVWINEGNSWKIIQETWQPS
jgi:hypothetical protein